MSIPNDHIVVGTCGNCGGPVTVLKFWFGTTQPLPECRDCGATAKPNYGHVLPMQGPAVRPPLGLKPRAIHNEHRVKEITGAMLRYTEARKSIPKEWVDELRDLRKG